jgi:hypothetical protein
MQKVQIVSVTEGAYYSSEYASGGTVNVTLQRGGDFVSCDGILIFESEQVDNDLFDDWVAAAMEGEEGFSAMIGQGDNVVVYSN